MEKKAALGTGKDKLTAEYERGAFRPVKHQARARHEAMKDGRITIRLSTADLEMLKRRSAEEGLPSQSLITSILHKYVSRSSPQTHEPVRFLNTYLQNPIGSHHTQYKIQPSDFRSWIRGAGHRRLKCKVKNRPRLFSHELTDPPLLPILSDHS